MCAVLAVLHLLFLIVLLTVLPQAPGPITAAAAEQTRLAA
jgi:hypothetical protein